MSGIGAQRQWRSERNSNSWYGRAAVSMQDSQIPVLGSRDLAETDCQGWAAVVFAPISADSLRKTGIFRDWAGDF